MRALFSSHITRSARFSTIVARIASPETSKKHHHCAIQGLFSAPAACFLRVFVPISHYSSAVNFSFRMDVVLQVCFGTLGPRSASVLPRKRCYARPHLYF
jgi:hypothetical protein